MERTTIALVTGANRGIGLEVCRQLLEAGYTVILSSRDEAKGKEAHQSLLSTYPDVHYHQLDVTDKVSIESMMYFIRDTFGRIDVLINNAGINYDTWHQALNADLDECHETVEANLFGPWRLAQAVVPMMIESGFGRVVNVSSGAGSLRGMAGGTPAYSVSKAGLNVLTIKFAAETKGKGVLVNAVCPGWVRTAMGGDAAPRSVAEGAKSVIWAALIPNDGPTGGFFRDGMPIDW